MPTMSTQVVIKTTFAGFHAWDTCNIAEVDFLKDLHRHIFYVTVKWYVVGDDRELEFFVCKSKVDDFIKNRWPLRIKGEITLGHVLGSRSCEMIAKEIMEGVNADFVSVFEDNENGAEVIREYPPITIKEVVYGSK